MPAATSTGYPQDGPPQASRRRRCGEARQAPVVPRNRVGSITAIEPVRQRPQGSGAGAVIGGVLGGVIGNQFGHGLGRAAMTGVGAAGGAIAGNNVERNYKTAVVGYRVHVRLDNGSTRTFERKNIGNLHVGDRGPARRERLPPRLTRAGRRRRPAASASASAAGSTSPGATTSIRRGSRTRASSST